MNDTEARLVIMLDNIPLGNKNTHYLAAKLNKSFSAVYNYLKILQVNGYVTKVRSNNKTFFETNSRAVIEAQKRLNSHVYESENNSQSI
jgi:Fe2+ or Zn2+ uptake regulation protein|tara:strand:+ start:680 stop:946 length:267 start_codon:yes stop_codon:yes gene_type:complete